MSNIYYQPEDFGLETVGQIDFSDGNYCFNYRVIWRRLSDGQLLTGADSGCSCPSPFEDVRHDGDLSEFSANMLLEEAREYAKSKYYAGDPISPWIEKVKELDREQKKLQGRK